MKQSKHGTCSSWKSFTYWNKMDIRDWTSYHLSVVSFRIMWLICGLILIVDIARQWTQVSSHLPQVWYCTTDANWKGIQSQWFDRYPRVATGFGPWQEFCAQRSQIFIKIVYYFNLEYGVLNIVTKHCWICYFPIPKEKAKYLMCRCSPRQRVFTHTYCTYLWRCGW